MVKRALLIGINYIGGTNELRGCHNDIVDIKKWLQSQGYTEFIILWDVEDTVSMLQPTYANIINMMIYMIKQTIYGDWLYIHYSGHGSSVADISGDENDSKDECICPVDYHTAGMIIDDHLHEILVTGLHSGCHLRVCFDSCHSGSALDLPYKWTDITKQTLENKYFRQRTDGTDLLDHDVIFISGCKDDQVSADALIAGKNNGAMTHALIATMKSRPVGELLMGNAYTWHDMISDMCNVLIRDGYSQTPQLGYCQTKNYKLKAEF